MLDFALPVPSLIREGGWPQEGHPAHLRTYGF